MNTVIFQSGCLSTAAFTAVLEHSIAASARPGQAADALGTSDNDLSYSHIPEFEYVWLPAGTLRGPRRGLRCLRGHWRPNAGRGACGGLAPARAIVDEPRVPSSDRAKARSRGRGSRMSWRQAWRVADVAAPPDDGWRVRSKTSPLGLFRPKSRLSLSYRLFEGSQRCSQLRGPGPFQGCDPSGLLAMDRQQFCDPRLLLRNHQRQIWP